MQLRKICRNFRDLNISQITVKCQASENKLFSLNNKKQTTIEWYGARERIVFSLSLLFLTVNASVCLEDSLLEISSRQKFTMLRINLKYFCNKARIET